MDKVLNKISDELKLPIVEVEIENQLVKKIGKTIIGYETFNDNGELIYEVNPENFPSTCKKRHIKNCIEAGVGSLGIIKKVNWRYFNDDFFTVIDIETTGFSPQVHSKIIEIGAKKIDKNGKIIDEFSRFVNPGEKLKKDISELTNITDDMLVNEPYIGTVMVDLWDFIKGTTLVFHNSSFDWDRFLTYEFEKKGLKFPKNYPCIDTLELDKYYFPEETSHKLNLMCERLGIEVSNHHRAIYDADMTAKAFIKFREISEEKFKNLDKTIWNLQDSNPDIKILSVNFWGKFKKDGTMKVGRQYVGFMFDNYYGQGYYDIIEDAWYMKTSKKPFLIDKIEDKVLEFTGCKNREELSKYNISKK